MPTIPTADPATTVLTDLCDPTVRITYSALPELSSVPVSTLWDRAHGRAWKGSREARK